MSDFLSHLQSAIQAVVKAEFLSTTKGVVVFFSLSALFGASLFALLLLLFKGGVGDFFSSYNIFVKDKSAWKQMKDYEYLVGLVYYDKEKNNSYMTTRIIEAGGKFYTYRQKVDGNNPVGNELSEPLLVDHVEAILLGLNNEDSLACGGMFCGSQKDKDK